jgi:hypothetical protein
VATVGDAHSSPCDVAAHTRRGGSPPDASQSAGCLRADGVCRIVRGPSAALWARSRDSVATVARCDATGATVSSVRRHWATHCGATYLEQRGDTQRADVCERLRTRTLAWHGMAWDGVAAWSHGMAWRGSTCVPLCSGHGRCRFYGTLPSALRGTTGSIGEAKVPGCTPAHRPA